MTAPIAAVLAGSAVAVTHWGDAAIPPGRRLVDLGEQLMPIDAEFAAIRRELARNVGLFDGRDDPARREEARTLIRNLRARAAANADRNRRVRTSDPELQAIRDALARAVRHERPARRPGSIRGDGRPRRHHRGPRALTATLEATRDYEVQQVRYMTRHGLIAPAGPARPDR